MGWLYRARASALVPAHIAAMLDVAAGPLDAPIRAEVFGQARFERHGISLGLTHRAVREHGLRETFSPRLRDNIQRLRQVNAYMGHPAGAAQDLSPAAQWLLENFHLLEAQFKEVDDGLPFRYFRGLPVLEQDPLAGLPRIYGVAWAYVAHTDSAFAEDMLVSFLNAYQQCCELRLSELWALPMTLRVVWMENLRRVADRLAANRAATELANHCSETPSQLHVATLQRLSALLRQRGVDSAFVLQLAQRLETTPLGEHLSVKAWLQTVVPAATSALQQDRAEQAADNLSVSNSVTSLRTLDDADWPALITRTNVCTQRMLGNPVFEAEHADTRKATMHGIERLARRSGRREVWVTQVLLQCLAMGTVPPEDGQVPAYWLSGAGLATLSVRLGLRAPLRWPWRRWPQGWALAVYLGAVVAGCALVLGGLLAGHGLAWGAWVASIVVLALPVSEMVVAVVNRLVSESLTPQTLPRLALAQGIAEHQRVAVVIPCMLVDTARTEALASRLLSHYLANPEPMAQFVLLTDLEDAPDRTLPGDAALVQHAVDLLQAMNQRYPMRPTAAAGGTAAGPAPLRFVLLHRERRFSRCEQAWIGWERKRGKLESMVALLHTGVQAPFVDLGAASRMARGTVYLLTLDADTVLAPGRLRTLVGIAAHPSNRPVPSADGRGVVRGYGILQPRVAAPLPVAAARTLYHWMFFGQPAMDAYSAASSEVYQDGFGEGTFSGKGLLHVETLHRVLGGRFAPGRILSHDLLEGALVRCAALSDVTLLEDAPHHPDAAHARAHRWTRGDWQLLPLMWHARREGISALNLWKMVDNLRRSLVPPACLLVMVLSLWGVGLTPGAAALLVLAAYTTGPFLGAVAGLFPGRPHVDWAYFLACAGGAFARSAVLAVWYSTQLVSQACAALDAVVRALYRQAWSHRYLLQWTPAASAQGPTTERLGATMVQHLRLSLGTVAVALVLAPWVRHPAWAVLWATLWSASPGALWMASQSRWARKVVPPDATARLYLADVAHATWRFFEQGVTASDHFLPPDNVQVLPYDMVAHRTSPTNIGLYLLSCVCAAQSGWIPVADCAARLRHTLDTLERLPRHAGHFFNWYDTQTLAPLAPLYVSTVDSGNLSAFLWTTAQACFDFAARSRAEDSAHARALASALTALAERLQALGHAPDYGFLYSPRRRLLHIGYRVLDQTLDAAFYDLMASEARLASLVAIAKGDVEPQHWAALGRVPCLQGTQPGLKSWSGSMFEYLMPSLLLDEPYGSLLQQAGVHAVIAQRAYAAQLGVPWGMSESAYAGRDASLAYQYAPQGVPSLALRRTPAGDCVVAPYATALALQVQPQPGVDNLRQLQALGARGAWGFMESVDYTPARQSGSEAFTVVATYMAHHQGMALVSMTNVLHQDIVKRWGMADPHLQAVSPLLHERMPREIPRAPKALPGQDEVGPALRFASLVRSLVPGRHAVEPTLVLSNGRYALSLRAQGSGASSWNGIALSRRRDDMLRDAYGTHVGCRVVDAAHSARVSVTRSPNPSTEAGARYRCNFHPDRAVFLCDTPAWKSQMTVWISPEDDIEFRQLEVHNLTGDALELELSCSWEVALQWPRADEDHPAFSNLFVRSQWLPAVRALLFERTPRVATDPTVCVAHFVAHTDAQVLSVRACADRQQWAGRNLRPGQDNGWSQGAEHGAAYFQNAAAGDSGLDPVSALVVRIQVAPYAKAQLTWGCAAGADPDILHALIDKYQHPHHIQRASLMSSTLADIRLQALRITPETLHAMHTLCTALLFVLHRSPVQSTLAAPLPTTECNKQSLWRMGISGDRPLIVVRIADAQGMGLVRSLAQAMRLWGSARLACDLVVVNAEPASYHLSLQRELVGLCESLQTEYPPGQAGGSMGMWVLRDDALSALERSTLAALARIHLQADGLSLFHHVQAWAARHDQDAVQRRQRGGSLPGGNALPIPSLIQASQGTFVGDSGAFRFAVDASHRPMRPWSNVLANAQFGHLLTEGGGGFSWAHNSRLNQLTRWSNDPVRDPPGEWLWLQDLDTPDRACGSVCPDAWAWPGVTYTVTHAPGETYIHHTVGTLEVDVRWTTDAALAVRQVSVQVRNTGPGTRYIRCVGMVEWIMGACLSDRATTTATQAVTEQAAVLLCTQREQAAGLAGGTAFWACATPGATAQTVQWTADRRSFFDDEGALRLPHTLDNRRDAATDADAAAGGWGDPCAALSVQWRIGAAQVCSHTFVMGFGVDAAAALALALQALQVPPDTRCETVQALWDQRLGTLTVATPDPLFDVLVNRWLLYQTIACRMAAKAGFYQAGGATGFRDQLQDAMALAWSDPQRLRAQVLTCASRQFVEGDVQHWWHSPTGAGVRTRISDDLLWLPHALVRYVQVTADTGVLDEQIPFLRGPVLEAGQEDSFFAPEVSDQSASVFEHAARALDRSLAVGSHGLPLMGSGDWNDGMNAVGAHGRGESVWLAWFLVQLVRTWAPWARARQDEGRAQRWEHAARGWQAALEGPAWDGQWYVRAFFDDGSPLGSHTQPECRIDLLAQAWAVLSHAAPPVRASQAMQAAQSQLADPGLGLVRLLWPPLQHHVPRAGYIQSYPPGVRENGGQYNHAAVWALMALAQLPGRSYNDGPYQAFCGLSPAHRSAHPVQGPVYGLEPYAMAADIYAAAPWTGRGGWSWYTGSAAWMYRAATESIFGLEWGPQRLCFTPCFPGHWERAHMRLRLPLCTLDIDFVRGRPEGTAPTPLGAAACIALEQGAWLDYEALRGAHSVRVPMS